MTYRSAQDEMLRAVILLGVAIALVVIGTCVKG